MEGSLTTSSSNIHTCIVASHVLTSVLDRGCPYIRTMSILMDMDTCYAHYFVARAAVAGDALVKGACLPALPASLPGALFILRGPNAPMGGSMWSSTSSLPRCWRGVFSIFVTETLSKALRRRFMFSPRQYLCIPARNLGLGRRGITGSTCFLGCTERRNLSLASSTPSEF